jgi:biotin operon repressor
MAFTVSEFRDLVQLLRDHPDWKAELRREILDEEFLHLPEDVRALAAAIDRLERAIEQNSEQLRIQGEQIRFQSEQIRLQGEAIVAQTEQIRLLVEHARHVDERLDRVDGRLNRLEGRMGNAEGDALENRYVIHCRSWFSRWLKRAEIIGLEDLGVVEDAVASGAVTSEQFDDLEYLDLIVRGADKTDPSRQRYLALEISATINPDDVERAERRAAVLRAAGLDVTAIAGGYRVSGRAQALANERGVIIDLRRPRSGSIVA